jgi:hypothetical protein
MNEERKSLTIMKARLIFRNFAGIEGKFNRAGDRNFCILLDHALAEQLFDEGWNVKALRSREEGDPPQPYLHVAVNFRGKFPAKVTMVTWNGKTSLDEDMVDLVDHIDIETADVILNPYQWSVNGKSGVKAYLKTLYVVVHEDELDKKYRHLDDLPTSSGRVIEAGPDYIDGELVQERLAIES